MHAASRGSLAEAREKLTEITRSTAPAQPPATRPAATRPGAPAAEPGVDRVALAADLRAVGVLLVREPGLRRALADATKEPARRVELFDQLLGGRIGGPAAELLRTVVGARWSSPADLVDTVELLAVDAELAEAQAGDALATVEDELFRFGRIVAGSPELGQLLSDPTTGRDRRIALVADLLDGKVNPVTARLATMAVHGIGGRNFDGSLLRVTELATARRDREIAYVTVASALTSAQGDLLAERLAGIYGRQVSLNVTVDPALLGGMTVRVGDDLYDGSIARRLEQARGALAK
jgi:F-type H+-transporting ATPase subunit delta